MKKWFFGIIFTLLSAIPLLLFMLSYKPGKTFSVNAGFDSFITSVSSHNFVTSNAFDNLLDDFEYFKDFDEDFNGDTAISAVFGSIFTANRHFFKFIVRAVRDLALVIIGPLADFSWLATEFASSLGSCWITVDENYNPAQCVPPYCDIS